MTADPQASISVSSEMPDIRSLQHVGAFLRATVLGAVAGGGPYMVFTVPIGGGFLAGTDLGLFVLMSLYPVLIATAVTLVAALVFGLPLTTVLRRSGEESARLYALLGLLLGFLIPLALLLFATWEPALFLAPGGLIAGGVTGFVWGRWRECCQQNRQAETAEPGHPNRIHDLLF